MQAFIKEKIPQLTQILKAHKVKSAYAFGSVCTEGFNSDSDIDLLVKFEEGIEPVEYSDNYFNLLFRLQDFLKREVDLVSETSLKNPFFIQSLNRNKQAIYE
jgi:predicted nucleotidyltransferase